MAVLRCLAALVIAGCDAERPGARSEPPSAVGSEVAASATPAPVQAQQQRPARSPLCLELNAPRDKVQVGEPVTLIASLVNCSPAPQEVQDLLSPDLGFLHVWIQPPRGRETIHRPLVKRDARGKRVRPLAPGQRLSTFVPVYFGPDGWTFTTPGEYRIRAEYSADAGSISAKPVSLTVLAPETQVDRRAAELFLSREVGLFFVTGRDDGGEASRKLAVVVEQYGSSRLAPYARLSLAIEGSRGRFDPKTKAFRNEGCERAIGDLERSVPNVGDPQLAATGASAWVRCLRQLGKDADTTRAVSIFFEAHPQARTVPAVAEALQPVSRKESP